VRLADTVLKTLEEQVFPSFGLRVPGSCSRMQRHEYPLPGGGSIVVMGLDDPARTQSFECSWIYVAEATELGKLDDVVALAGAMRQAYDAPGYFRQCIVDCNPGAPGHWLNQEAEPYPKQLRQVRTPDDYRRALEHGQRPTKAGHWKRVVTQYLDNPRYFDVAKWEMTADGRDYYEATLGNLKGHLRRRWLDGEWCAAEGAVFPEFDESRHVIRPFVVPETWPVYQLYDPGYDHPTGISWLAYAPNGRRYVIDEMKESGRSAQEWGGLIRRREEERGYKVVQRFADPHGAFSKSPGGVETIAEQMRKYHQLVYARWPGNEMEKEAMVNRHREILGTDLRDGRPMLQVFDRCTHTINEHQSWRYKRNPKGEQLKGDDQFEDANNDILDGLIGASAMNLSPAGQRVTRARHDDEPDKYRWSGPGWW
jgi:hypothetical protein